MKPVRPLPEPNLFCLAIDLAVVLIGIWWFLVGIALGFDAFYMSPGAAVALLGLAMFWADFKPSIERSRS